MQFEEHEIISITSQLPNISLIRIKPKRKKYITKFLPGQFYHIKNPTHENPQETRPFSITTTPQTKEYLEFCIKTYGPWTQNLLKKKIGESVWLFGPMGSFTLPDQVQHAVFIAGGVGITPIVSILASLHETNHPLPLTLLYANKFPHTILKRNHLDGMFHKKAHWKLLSIVSESTPDTLWNGSIGHITKECIQNNSNATEKSIFFVCGSHRFTKNIIELLESCNIKRSSIKQEIFSPAVTS